jgi:LuxR family maltose regulon positive regulatory protein
MVTIAKIKRAGGDFPGALAIVEECENQIAMWNKPHWLYILRAFKARLHLEAANMEAADRWIADSRLGVFQEITSCREYELIVLSRMFIAKQRCDDASLLLCRLLAFAEAKNRAHSAVEICNLLAINANLNEDEEAAYHYIEKSLHIGMQEGFVRSFGDELYPMTVLLKLYLGRQKKRSAPKAYAKKLLEQTEASLRLSATCIDINSAEKNSMTCNVFSDSINRV